MAAELGYFCATVFYGVAAAFCYHILMFFRTVIKHNVSFADAEDILFLMAAGFAFFLVIYERNDGILRWYAFAGAGLGCLAYIRTLGSTLEQARMWLLQKRRKAVKIKAKFNSKRQVPVDEGSSPEHGKKEKKKKRS